jgi:quercetin dioxygenase-like cupin family protein
MASELRPFFVPRGEAPQYSFSGLLCRPLISGGDSSGAFTLVEMRIQPGRGAPPHISAPEDKGFYVVAGTFSVLVGEETRAARAGDAFFVPRGTIHSFTNVGQAEGTVLLAAAPAGHERFFRDLSLLPEPHALADVLAVCRQHGQELVTPEGTR